MERTQSIVLEEQATTAAPNMNAWQAKAAQMVRERANHSDRLRALEEDQRAMKRQSVDANLLATQLREVREGGDQEMAALRDTVRKLEMQVLDAKRQSISAAPAASDLVSLATALQRVDKRLGELEGKYGGLEQVCGILDRRGDEVGRKVDQLADAVDSLLGGA